MNVQVFLCGGGSSFDSFAHGSLSLAVTAGAKNLNNFLPSAAFDHFWHTEEIFEEIYLPVWSGINVYSIHHQLRIS